ncbi:MAG: phosphoribosylglycinamide formyltransferase [Flavobacteriales bacterium]
MSDKPKRKIAILASGAGSNAHRIIQHFKNSTTIEVALVACNKPNAGVLNIATENQIPTYIITKENFVHSDDFLKELKQRDIEFAVLAGFLWKVPAAMVMAYPNSIVNIHPALLPRYGGKGMYGHFVHEAVCSNKERESGITIHYVNEHYDEGNTIFQARVDIDHTDTPQTIEQKVRALEIEHYASVLDDILNDRM